MTEQPDLKARVEELRRVAEAALEAASDNGHCGEGTMEYRARRERRIATEQAHIATFDPPTILALLSRLALAVSTLRRVSEATEYSTNSRTAADFRSWTKAVADTALAEIENTDAR